MDDYKELISTLRTIAGYRDSCYDCDYCIQAADAIEALLDQLREFGCCTCKHFGTYSFDSPCCNCVGTNGSEKDKWELGGPA